MNELRSLPKEVWILTVSRFIMALGFASSFPFISIYLYEAKSLSATLTGTILTTSYILGTSGRLVATNIINAFGLKNTLILITYLRSILFALLSAIVYLDLDYKLIVPILILNSITLNISLTTIDTIVANITHESERNIAYSVNRVGINLGWALGPAIGGFIYEKAFFILFAITSITTFISGSINLFMLEVKNVRRRTNFLLEVAIVLKDRRFLYFALVSLTLFVSMSQIISTLSIYATNFVGISKSELGIAYMINGLMVVFLQVPLSILANRFGEKLYLTSGMLIYALSFLLLGFIDNIYELVGCILILTLGEMLAIPTVQSIASKLARRRFLSTYIGLLGIFQNIGWALGPSIGGAILDMFRHNHALIWGSIALIPLAGAILFGVFKISRK